MNLVLIGDSIRLSYQPVVEERLAGVMRVRGPADNCASTRDILAHFDDWITALVTPGSTVHLNAGLHDLRRLDGDTTPPSVPIEEYRRNLGNIVRRVDADPHVSRVVLATSTPVDDARHATGRVPNRFQRDVLMYNEVVLDVAERHSLEVHDLHAVIAADAIRYLDEDGVHLTAAGARTAGRAVASVATP